MKALSSFRWATVARWWKWLKRRNRLRILPWTRMQRLLEHYPLPPARVMHSVMRPARQP